MYNKIYCGFVNWFFCFVGLYVIFLMVVYEDENGEKYIFGRVSYGDDFGDYGYIRILLEVMFFYIFIFGEVIDDKFLKYFFKLVLFFSRFFYLKLLFLKDEEVKCVKYVK